MANSDQFDRRGLSNVGRKAYASQILLKLYLYGYLHGISSSRKLETVTKRNMELMWLLGQLSSDHKTIANYRKNHGEAIRFLTQRFRDYLIHENYIAGKEVAFDGTKIKANAAKGKLLRTKSLERSSLKKIHRTDPDCRNMCSGDGFIPAYNEQMITDMSWGIIAHPEVLTEPGDRGLTEEMIDNLEAETSIVPEELFADAAYYSIDQLH